MSSILAALTWRKRRNQTQPPPPAKEQPIHYKTDNSFREQELSAMVVDSAHSGGGEEDDVSSPQLPRIPSNLSPSTQKLSPVHKVDKYAQEPSPPPPKPQFLTLLRPRPPCTPEGLRPRRSLVALRKELGEVNNNESVHPHVASPPKVYQGIRTRQLPSQPRPLSVLPPRHGSSSWSTQGVLSSPPISKSSFYQDRNEGQHTSSYMPHGHQQQRPVATSPHLLPGKARTAVGALVARQQLQQQPEREMISTGASAMPLPPPPPKSLPAFPRPPSEWEQDWPSPYPPSDREEAEEEPYRQCSDDSEESIQILYYPLDVDPVQNVRSPIRPELSPRQPSAVLEQSPCLSLPSSMAPSPSSRNRPYPPERRVQPPTTLDDSFGSRAQLVPSDRASQKLAPWDRYDFGPVAEGTEVVLTAGELGERGGGHHQNWTDLSAMSQSSVQHHHHSHRGPTMVNGYDRVDPYQQPLHHDDDEDVDTAILSAMEGELQRRKFVHQRRAKEDLVLAAIERLQDNLELLNDVEKISKEAVGMGDWFVQTPLDQPSILTGIPQAVRYAIVRELNAILVEMNAAVTEEFMLSPSNMSGYIEPHHDLRASLIFCKTLMEMAVPASERMDEADRLSREGRWACAAGLRSSLGVLPTESPLHAHQRPRGGDTSLFSLPSESADNGTPMTSNVSVTTSITTVQTSPHGSRALAAKLATNGWNLRRTIEILSTLLQHLSRACLRFGQSERKLGTDALIQVTGAIKRNYLQLLAMNQVDMRALVDSFQLVLAPLPPSVSSISLHREVSRDDDEVAMAPLPFLPPFPASLMLQRAEDANAHESTTAAFSCLHSSPMRRPQAQSRQSQHLFSPSTQDMRTVVPLDDHVDDEDDEFDDLRRTVGSIDRGDMEEEGVECVREGPEECQENHDPAIFAHRSSNTPDLQRASGVVVGSFIKVE